MTPMNRNKYFKSIYVNKERENNYENKQQVFAKTIKAFERSYIKLTHL